MSTPQIQAIIIDDEKHCRDALTELLTKHPEVKLLDMAHNVKDGIALIKSSQPDLVFLDIEMPDGNGFDVLAAFAEPSFQVIFTTGHHDYAIEAFRHSAIDYLLKPVQSEELHQALDKIKPASNLQNQHEQMKLMLESLKSQDFSKLAIPSVEGYEFVEKKDIIYCEADGSYAKIHLEDGKSILSTHNLKRIDQLLASDGFFRVHKSYIIALKHIKKILHTEGGQVVLNNELQIPIARRRKEEFLNLLGL